MTTFLPDATVTLPSGIVKQLLKLHDSAVLVSVSLDESGQLALVYKYPAAGD